MLFLLCFFPSLWLFLSSLLSSRHFTGDIRFLLERKKQLSEAEEEEEEVIDAWFLSSSFEG